MGTVSAFQLADKASKVINNNTFNVIENGQFGSKVIARGVPYGNAAQLIRHKPWSRKISFN